MSSKLRKALSEILDIASPISTGDDDDPVERIAQIAEAALAEPVLNCEVGTVEEQTERFRKFCFAHMKKGGGDFRCHKNCPAKNYIGGWGIPYCQLKWAQMPYEKGEQNEQK